MRRSIQLICALALALALAWIAGRDPGSSGAKAELLAPPTVMTSDSDRSTSPLTRSSRSRLATESRATAEPDSEREPTGSPSEFNWVGKREGTRVVYASSIDYLEDYWGDRWPLLRRELEIYGPERLKRYEGMKLTEEMVPPPLSEIGDELVRRLMEEIDHEDWLKVQASMVRAEAWPERLTSEFVGDLVGRVTGLIDEDLVRRCEDVAHSHRAELGAVRQEYYAAAREAAQTQAMAGRYIVWPLVQAGHGMDPLTGEPAAADPPNGRIFTLSFSYWGLWIVHMYIHKAQYPAVQDLRTQLKVLGEARLDDVRALLNGH
jgi:hypothetical protein